MPRKNGQVRQRGDSIAEIVIRNVPEEVKREIEVRASRHGHSIEQEALNILIAGLNRGSGRMTLGTLCTGALPKLAFSSLICLIGGGSLALPNSMSDEIASRGEV